MDRPNIRQTSITLSGIVLEVWETEGDGPPIFFFHGNSSAANSFLPVLNSALGQRRRLIAVSWPGHGASQRATAPYALYSLEGFSNLAVQVIQAYNTPTYWLVGHSLGGHVLLESLDRLSGALGLMLLSSPPLSLATMALAFKPDLTQGALFKGDLTAPELNTLSQSMTHGQSQELLQTIRDNLLQTDPMFRSQLGASLAQGQLRDERQLYMDSPIPIALVAGDRDAFIDLNYYASLPARAIWSGGPILLKNAGHALHMDHPKRISQLIEDFLEDEQRFHRNRGATPSKQTELDRTT